MFIQGVDRAQANRSGIQGRKLLSLCIGLLFALTVHPGKARAQISGEIEANIPFQFHAGDTKLPPGNYVIHPLDNTDLTIMEISSADGTTSALFEVRDAAASSAPAKTELIFNKYGSQYFLAKMFDEGVPDGSNVVESRYEKRIGQASKEAQAHVPAHHKGQQGN